MLEDLYIKPRAKYYSSGDTSFVSGDSPVVLDVKGSVDSVLNDGYIICDGAGDILVEISSDGTNYNDQIRLKSFDVFSLKALVINKIRITHSGTDSAYRVFCL